MLQIPTNHAANPQIQNISFKLLHLSKAKMQQLTTGGNQFLKYYSKNNIEKIVPLCPSVVPLEAENERWKAFDPRLTHFYSISAVGSDSGQHHNNNIQRVYREDTASEIQQFKNR